VRKLNGHLVQHPEQQPLEAAQGPASSEAR
jgi:hypothetical protein